MLASMTTCSYSTSTPPKAGDFSQPHLILVYLD